jgi:hypothetical protein
MDGLIGLMDVRQASTTYYYIVSYTPRPFKPSTSYIILMPTEERRGEKTTIFRCFFSSSLLHLSYY